MKLWLANFLDPQRQRLLRDAGDEIGRLEHGLAIASRELALLRREVLPCPVPASAPDWRPEHQTAWRTFLASPAGTTLRLRGRAIQFHTATQACQDVFHTSHSAGSAKGFGECLDWLDSLSRASTRSNDDSLSGGTEGSEKTNDATPSGETVLRELLSP